MIVQKKRASIKQTWVEDARLHLRAKERGIDALAYSEPVFFHLLLMHLCVKEGGREWVRKRASE